MGTRRTVLLDPTNHQGNETINGNLTVNGNITGYTITATTAFNVVNGQSAITRPAAAVLGLTASAARDGGIYISSTNAINAEYSVNGVTSMFLNYTGYQAGTTQFRNLVVGDGKQNTLWTFLGSSGKFYPENDNTFSIGDSTHRVSTVFTTSIGTSAAPLGQLYSDYTDAPSTGNQTQNKMSGSVYFAAAAGALTVTNALCTTSSKIFAMITTSGSTGKIGSIVPGNGSFVINMSTNPASQTAVNWFMLSTN